MGNHDFEQTEGLEPVLRAYRMGGKATTILTSTDSA